MAMQYSNSVGLVPLVFSSLIKILTFLKSLENICVLYFNSEILIPRYNWLYNSLSKS